MNGGVILQTNAHNQLPTPVLKQELITEHYAISAKRPSQKDKERMNRSAKANNFSPEDQQNFLPNMIAPGQAPFAPYPAVGYYQQPGYYIQPVPGPSRRASHPNEVLYPGQPFQYEPTNYAQPTWETHSADSASVTSHKRKRSGSSLTAEELRTPRKANHTLPESISAKLQHSIGGQSQLPTPPATGEYTSSPPHLSPEISTQPAPEKRASGVYVTATEEEGRKLGLRKSSSGPEETSSIQAPPRTKPTTVLSVDDTGVASLTSADVLQTDLALIEGPTTPKQPARQVIPGTVNDTPNTKEDKMKRRLTAFKTTSHPPEPMYSIRLDMGQGAPTRVALRKDIALAFIGMDKATNVVEERRGEDDDGWAAADGRPRAPIRPDWPDEEEPWKAIGTRRVKQLREDRERDVLLRRYLESSSDDDDDHDAAAHFPILPSRHARTASGSHPPADDPTDARAALWHSMRRVRRPAGMAPPPMIPTGVMGCACKSTGSNGSLVSCSSCKTWHHVACVGIEEVSLTPSWVCDPCVAQARRATLSTPSARTPPMFGSNDRSMSAFRGNQALALAPSPMFAGEAARAASNVGAVAARTPYTPSRRRERARVLSYGNEWGVSGEEPSTPVPASRAPDSSFATPRIDDPIFDVNSTPSRHLSTDPRMAGQFTNNLFAITPLVGRSRNTTTMLMVGDTPVPAGRGRNVSGVPPFSDGVASRHEFLQGLTGGRGELPDTPFRRTGLGHPASPSPFGHSRRGSSKFSHMRSSSRSGLGLGLPLDDVTEK